MFPLKLRRNFSVYVLLLLFCVFPENRTRHTLSPWKSPLEGLQWITAGCKIAVPGFDLIAYKGMSNWQSCMDSAIPNPTGSFSSDAKNFSDISDIPYCENQESYKGCWSTVINALNACVQTVKDVAGAIYFGLDDEWQSCNEIWITVVSNMKSNFEENPCQSDYSNIVCEREGTLLNSGNLCLRFHSNSACDLDSAHPNCTSQSETGLYGEVFEKARYRLNCQSSIESNSGDIITGVLSIYTITMLIPTNFAFKS